MKGDMAKNLDKDSIESTLSKITLILPRIHRFECSCPIPTDKFWFSKDDFEKRMPLKRVQKLSDIYREGFFYTNLKRKINFLISPYPTLEPTRNKRNRPPGIYLSSTYPDPYFLLKLLEYYKILNLSYIEYAIDFFCKDNDSVRDLYYLLKKYLVIKGARKSRISKKDKRPIQNIRILEPDNDLNFTCIFNNLTKIYERGDEKNRIKKGWKFESIDRLRLEFTAKNYKIKNLLGKNRELFDFFEKNYFKNFLHNKFYFMFLKNKPSYHKDISSYIIGTKKPYYTCLMDYKHKKKIPFKSLNEAKEFDSLKSAIFNAIRKYENEWSKEAADYKKTMKTSKYSLNRDAMKMLRAMPSHI
jgi:hypothetical protein